jgi:nucleoid DNA-binding protein
MATKSKKNVKSAAKKSAKPAAKVMKIVPVTGDKPRSKGQTMTEIAEHTGLARKQVASVFETLGKLMEADLGKKGPGSFVVHGMMKVLVINKPATKARSAPNPFKPGEMMTIKAKPARRLVKIRPMKALKGMVG